MNSFLRILFLCALLFQGVEIFPQMKLQLNNIAAEDTAAAQYRMPFTYAGNLRYTIDGYTPKPYTELRPVQASVIGSLYLGAIIGLYIHQSNAWWSDSKGNFHFVEDWVSALQVDKFGHAYGGFASAYLMREGLLYAGIDDENSHIYGALFGLAYQTYVEVGDGFAGDWGFSPTDFYFDAFGAGYFLAQYYMPYLQNFTPKWQYIPSEYTGKPVIQRPRTMLDDYNSTTFYMSVDVHRLLPLEYKKYWVPWLNLAFGYGGDAIDFKMDPNGPPDQLSKRRYVLSLDFNVMRMLPEGNPAFNWIKQCFNHIKLPSPSIEFSEGRTKFYILYPFSLGL